MFILADGGPRVKSLDGATLDGVCRFDRFSSQDSIVATDLSLDLAIRPVSRVDPVCVATVADRRSRLAHLLDRVIAIARLQVDTAATVLD